MRLKFARLYALLPFKEPLSQKCRYGTFLHQIREATFLICVKQTAEVALFFGTKIPRQSVPSVFLGVCA